jgi:hypothetical protein
MDTSINNEIEGRSHLPTFGSGRGTPLLQAPMVPLDGLSW